MSRIAGLSTCAHRLCLNVLLHPQRYDDELYEDFQAKFPELFADDAKKVAILDEDEMKSPANKTRWRNFINA